MIDQMLYIYGASGHGKVILDCCRSMKLNVNGFIDDDATRWGQFQGLLVSGYDSKKDTMIICGVGDNGTRKEVAKKLQNIAPPIIHPSACVHQSIVAGRGTVIFHHAVLQVGTFVGEHCIINTSASVDHDCFLSNFVHIGPHATLCGGIMVGEGSFVGAGAVITPNVKVGKWSTIGAGSVIIKDVPDYSVIVGNPGKVVTIKPDESEK